MKRLQLAIAAMAFLALVACSAGSADPPALERLAEKVGCTDVKQVDAEVFTFKQATCVDGSHLIELHTFSSENARDNWLDVAKEKKAGKVRHGDAWATLTHFGATSAESGQPPPRADVARQAKICAELFPADPDDWVISRASDLVSAYIDNRAAAQINVEAATGLRTRLHEVAARSPEPLATQLAATVDGLDLLRDIGSGRIVLDHLDAVNASTLFGGNKAITIRCRALRDQE